MERPYLLTGHLPHFARDPLGFLERSVAAQGDFVPLRFFHRRVLLINRPEQIEQVLSIQAKNFRKTLGYRSPIMRRLFGQGLLTNEGSSWMRQRKLAQPAFHRERISTYSQHIIAYAGEMTSRWQNGVVRDVHDDVLKLTTRVVTKSLFGVESAEEVSAVGESSRIVMERFNMQWNGWRILLNLLPTKTNKEFEKVMQRLDAFVLQVVEERRKEEGNDLVSMLLRARDENGEGMSQKQLRDELVTLMAAGLDTTALALSWALYLLARHPDEQDALRKQTTSLLAGRDPSLQDYPELKMAEAVIKESMRLFPPAWIIGREALNDCEIGDRKVKQGTSIIMSQWLMHRDPRHFNEPLKFRPSRWLSGECENIHKFAYFPFGGGPRICIGNMFAMIEAVLVLSHIVQRAKVSQKTAHEVKPWPAITLHPRGPINLLIDRL